MPLQGDGGHAEIVSNMADYGRKQLLITRPRAIVLDPAH
jgi:hypothetical protein